MRKLNLLFHYIFSKNPLAKDFYWHQLKLSENRDFKKNKYIVLDLELSGLDWHKDKILSIGGVFIEEGKIDVKKSFHYLFNEKVAFNDLAVVHGIMGIDQDSMGHNVVDILERLISLTRDTIVVGHFSIIDIQFLKKEFKNRLNIEFNVLYRDTAQIYKNYKFGPFVSDSEIKNDELTLKNVSQVFRINKSNEHNALADSFTCAELFLILSNLRS